MKKEFYQSEQKSNSTYEQNAKLFLKKKKKIWELQ